MWSWNSRNLHFCRFRFNSRLSDVKLKFQNFLFLEIEEHHQIFLLKVKSQASLFMQVMVHLQTHRLEVRIPDIIFAVRGASPDFPTWSWNSRILHFWRLRCISRLSDINWNCRNLFYFCKLRCIIRLSDLMVEFRNASFLHMHHQIFQLQVEILEIFYF